jgi:predicted HicB family RNase H-like nuclease
MEKAQAIKNGKEYDTGIQVPLNLSNDLLLEAALNAHRQNITLNDYINQALAELVEKVKSGEITKDDMMFGSPNGA